MAIRLFFQLLEIIITSVKQVIYLSQFVRVYICEHIYSKAVDNALIWAVVCLCAAPRVQLFAIAGNAWPHNAPRYHQLMPINCHFRDCKALLALNSAI